MSVTTTENALIVHAVGAPLVFAALSTVYFRRFRYSTPFVTAVAFTIFVMAMDFFVVATIILRSYAMFYSVLGTWIPFVLIFLSTYLTGRHETARVVSLVDRRPV